MSSSSMLRTSTRLPVERVEEVPEARTAALASLGTTRDMAPAGRPLISGDDGGAAAAVATWADGRRTPERERKFRSVQEPGVRVPPPGPMREEEVVSKDVVFGKIERAPDESASAAIHSAKGPMEAYMEQRGAAIYRSVRQEPLGTMGSPVTRLPERVKGPDFAFGKKSSDPEGVKDLTNPEIEGEEKGLDLYIKSHRAYPPGVQRRRGVDFASVGIDPVRHRFGKAADRGEKDGTAQCLDPSLAAEAKAATVAREVASSRRGAVEVGAEVAGVARTRIVPLRVEAHRRATGDPLGKSRPLGHAAYARAPPAIFGKPPRADDDWGAAECLKGDARPEDMMPDEDLGRSTRPGFRNIAVDPDRVFGKPSLRTDVPPRKHTSVMSRENFGQDPEMKQLLGPSAYASRGVDHADFVASRDDTELREIFQTIGYEFSDHEFQQIAKRARQLDLTPESLSVEEFRRALNEYHDHIDSTGTPPEWFEPEE